MDANATSGVKLTRNRRPPTAVCPTKIPATFRLDARIVRDHVANLSRNDRHCAGFRVVRQSPPFQVSQTTQTVEAHSAPSAIRLLGQRPRRKTHSHPRQLKSSQPLLSLRQHRHLAALNEQSRCVCKMDCAASTDFRQLNAPRSRPLRSVRIERHAGNFRRHSPNAKKIIIAARSRRKVQIHIQPSVPPTLFPRIRTNLH